MATFAITDNLDWTVSKRPLAYPMIDGSFQRIAEKVAVVRDDNDQFLGTVSPQYEIVQNEDLLSLINPMVAEGTLVIENVGYLNKGAKVFIQAKVNKEYQVIGEDYRSYITLLNGHTANASVAIGTTFTRVICGNTFACAYSDIGEKYRHQVGVTERVLETKAVINYVNGAMETYAKYMETLDSSRCTHTQFRAFLEETYGKDLDKMRNVERLNALFYEGAGNSGQTFHDAFQAVTDFGSNQSRKSSAGRFNYVNFGTGAAVNQRALRVALEMAAV